MSKCIICGEYEAMGDLQGWGTGHSDLCHRCQRTLTLVNISSSLEKIAEKLDDASGAGGYLNVKAVTTEA